MLYKVFVYLGRQSFVSVFNILGVNLRLEFIQSFDNDFQFKNH